MWLTEGAGKKHETEGESLHSLLPSKGDICPLDFARERDAGLQLKLKQRNGATAVLGRIILAFCLASSFSRVQKGRYLLTTVGIRGRKQLQSHDDGRRQYNAEMRNYDDGER
jgi:hypothetical protein